MDIVETGSTLKENGLEVLEEVCPLSARMIVNPVEVVKPPEPLPRLPVARAVWKPAPDLETSAAAWIQAGGAHHTAFSYDVTADQLSDFAALAGVEFVVIQ